MRLALVLRNFSITEGDIPSCFISSIARSGLITGQSVPNKTLSLQPPVSRLAWT